MRLSGLASGFDTDTMVQNLMRVERMRVDRFTQRKQVNLWRQQEYNKMNNNLANFILNSKKNMGLNKVSSTGTITSGSYKNLDYVSKATSSNEDVLGVSVIGKATNGSFDVEVESVASSAGLTADKISKEDLKGIEPFEVSLGKDANGDEIKINIKGKGDADITVEDIANAINNHKVEKDGKKVETGLTAFYDKNTDRIFIQKEATDYDVKENKNGTFNVDFKITGSKDDDKLRKLQSKFEKGTGDGGATIKAGNLTKVKINDVDVYSKNTSIEFNGLKLEAKKAEPNEKIRINVSTNTDGIVEKIQGLVDEYNELLDTISKATGEKRYSNYHPLSQEEKKEMTEDDIKLWEEKAQSGMLNNDETLNRMLQNIRTDMFKDVDGLEGKFKNITQLGITTEKYSKGATGGKLQIDESKLRAAIEEDAEGVMELLFSEEKKDAATTKDGNSNRGNSNKGVFTGVYDGIIDGMKSIIDKSGPGEDSDLLRNVKSNILIDFVTKRGSISDIDKDVLDMEKRISDMEKMLLRKEEGYYSQFTAMEKYMYEMNSQSQWLGQQMMM